MGRHSARSLLVVQVATGRRGPPKPDRWPVQHAFAECQNPFQALSSQVIPEEAGLVKGG